MSYLIKNGVSTKIVNILKVHKNIKCNKPIKNDSIVDRLQSCLKLKPINKKTEMTNITFSLSKERLKVSNMMYSMMTISSFLQ